MINNAQLYINANPPYVEAEFTEYINIEITKDCHNLYTYVIENTLNNIKHSNSKMGVILPSACISTPRMKNFQDFLKGQSENMFISTYDDRPGKLFNRLEHMRAAIIISDINKDIEKADIYTTKYNRWYSDERKELFKSIKYSRLLKDDYVEGYIPKLSFNIENSILNKIFSKKTCINDYICNNNCGNNIYYGYGVQYWIKAMDKSASEVDNTNRKSTGEKTMFIEDKFRKEIFVDILNSNIFYWYFLSFSDCRNLTKNTISLFPFNYEELTYEQEERLKELCDELMQDYISNSKFKECNYASTGKIQYREYYPKKSKNIIDKIDRVLSEYYGLSNEELDFIANYDMRFRLGDGYDEL